MTAEQDPRAAFGRVAPAAHRVETAPSPKMPDPVLTLIRDDGALRATRLPGEGHRLVVVFNSIAGARERAQPDEFRRLLAASPENRPIFLTDQSKGWFAGGAMMEDVRAVVEAEAARPGVVEIVAIGSSMGGFAALALAGLLPLQAALALAPRYSPDDRVVPDRRLVAHRAARGPFTPQTVETGLAASPFSVVLHGLSGRDRQHASRFPVLASLHHYLVPDVAHAVAASLSAADLLGDTIEAAFARNKDALDRTMRRLGAFSRLRPPLPEGLGDLNGIQVAP